MSAGARLTPEQRQQAIDALLNQRRSRISESSSTLDEDAHARRERVQKLLQERASAKLTEGGVLSRLSSVQSRSYDELLSPGSSISQVSDKRAHSSRIIPQGRQQQHQQQSLQPSAIMEEHSEAYTLGSQQLSELLSEQLDEAPAGKHAALLELASGGPVDVSTLWARDGSSSGTRDSLASQGSLLEDVTSQREESAMAFTAHRGYQQGDQQQLRQHGMPSGQHLQQQVPPSLPSNHPCNPARHHRHEQGDLHEPDDEGFSIRSSLQSQEHMSLHGSRQQQHRELQIVYNVYQEAQQRQQQQHGTSSIKVSQPQEGTMRQSISPILEQRQQQQQKQQQQQQQQQVHVGWVDSRHHQEQQQREEQEEEEEQQQEQRGLSRHRKQQQQQQEATRQQQQQQERSREGEHQWPESEGRTDTSLKQQRQQGRQQGPRQNQQQQQQQLQNQQQRQQGSWGGGNRAQEVRRQQGHTSAATAAAASRPVEVTRPSGAQGASPCTDPLRSTSPNRHSRAAATERAMAEQMQREQQWQPAGSGRGERCLPESYPASREQRLVQLAQPRSLKKEKYQQIKAEQEADEVKECRFIPQTGRGPQQERYPSVAGLPAGERLYLTAAEQKRRREAKVAELAAVKDNDCTFKPQINHGSIAKHLEGCAYQPIHDRLGQLLRNRSERLSHLRLQVEKEQGSVATYTPAINPVSAELAEKRRKRFEQQQQQQGYDQGPPPQLRRSASPWLLSRDQHKSIAGSTPGLRTSKGAGSGLKRAMSESDLAQRCSFSPAINPMSKVLLEQSREIPSDFLERQAYYDNRTREKKQLLQLAIEDQECRFLPTYQSTDAALLASKHSSMLEESYLERIERLAYKDQQKVSATRQALAQTLYSDCTFKPSINPRSKRIAKPTPLQELHENRQGAQRRAAVAAEVELEREEECTFMPNTTKHTSSTSGAPHAKLSLSGGETEELLERLHNYKSDCARKAVAASNLAQYDEMKECTFTPVINQGAPKQAEKVCVRGLSRYMELKAMAKQRQAEAAMRVAKVFHERPKAPTQPFTVPQPFNLTCNAGSCSSEERTAEGLTGKCHGRRTAAAEADAAVLAECTFQPATRAKATRKLIARILAEDIN